MRESKRRQVAQVVIKGEITVKSERRIHECAHLFALDDRLSRNVEGEMVPSGCAPFSPASRWLRTRPQFYKKLCERSYRRIALISAIFRDAGTGQRPDSDRYGDFLEFSRFSKARKNFLQQK